MANAGAVQVKLELGHRAQVRKRATAEGFTHDWTVFVRGPERSNIQHFVDKVVFYLHESFPRPRRVCKDPPYRVEESGYAGFILPIEVYFRNKEEPKKVRFDYDLFLHLEGHPPVNHLRCEKLTFNNPTEEFRRRLLKAGGHWDPHKRPTDDPKVTVSQEGSTRLHSQHLKPLPLPDDSATPTLAHPKNKSFPSSKDLSRGGGGAFLTASSTSSGAPCGFSKLHKPSKDQRHRKEPKGAFGEVGRASKGPPGRPRQDVKSKTGSREPKAPSKDPETEDEDLDSAPAKRPSGAEGDRRPTKKQRTGLADAPGRRRRRGSGGAERRAAPGPPPFQDLVDPDPSEGEDQPRSDSEQPSPASSTSSPGRGATPQKGPDGYADVREEDSEEEPERDLDSDAERLAPAHRAQRPRRVTVSLSDGCESNSSSPSPPSHGKAPPSLGVANHQQAYLEELVELHRRLMALREGRVLQQVVNLIEETGHFHISGSTFDFDLCSLDRSTVRKLQGYLEASRPS